MISFPTWYLLNRLMLVHLFHFSVIVALRNCLVINHTPVMKIKNKTMKIITLHWKDKRHWQWQWQWQWHWLFLCGKVWTQAQCPTGGPWSPAASLTRFSLPESRIGFQEFYFWAGHLFDWLPTKNTHKLSIFGRNLNFTKTLLHYILILCATKRIS